jgi:enoyl-CoA hydratase
MSGDCVLTRREGPVLVVTINRPEKRNAVDRPTAEALRAAFSDPERQGYVLAAVLTGGGGTFCAGADLEAMGDDKRRNEVEPTGTGAGPMGPTRSLPGKPVIAAVAGHAVAGGLELALWCDMRVAEESAVFGVFCRRFGVPLIDGGTVRLPRLVGQGRALDMILTGRPVAAQEALSIGLCDRVVPTGGAEAAAIALAGEIAAFPQACLRADRRSLYAQWDHDLAEALRREGEGGFSIIEKEAIPGAKRFAQGEGRHGRFGKEG